MLTDSPFPAYRLDDFRTEMRARNLAPRTIKSRMEIARRIAQQWPDPSTVTTPDVVTFLSNPTFGRWTRSTYFGAVRALCRFLVSVEAIDQDLTATLIRPSSPRSRPRPLTVVEAQRARAAAGGDTYAVLMLGLLAGLRAHEVAKLHTRDVTASGIYVRGKGGVECVLPAHPEILRLAAEREGYWFPSPIHDHVTGQTVSSWVTTLFVRLEIEGSFHRCRHYYGTSLLRAGVNIRVVQELMRHSSLATTAAYLGVDDDEKQAAILALAS